MLYHIVRRKDGSVKSFGRGDGQDWADPELDVEVFEGELADVEAELRAQLAPDPEPAERRARRQQREQDLAAARQLAREDEVVALLLRLLDQDAPPGGRGE